MTDRLTVLTCQLSMGAAICSVCGSMVPDYCMRGDTTFPVVFGEIVSEETPVPDVLPEVFYVDASGTVTEELPELPATDTAETVPEPVSESPVAPPVRRKRRGGK